MIIDAARMSVGDLNPRTVGDLELIEQEAPQRGIWHCPPKSKKTTQTRKAAPDEQETPKRGIWHRPQKRQKKNPNTKSYAKPFCSDGGSVILSTLITAPRRGCIHPAPLSF